VQGPPGIRLRRFLTMLAITTFARLSSSARLPKKIRDLLERGPLLLPFLFVPERTSGCFVTID
jgi:hypothetical protein